LALADDETGVSVGEGDGGGGILRVFFLPDFLSSFLTFLPLALRDFFFP